MSADDLKQLLGTPWAIFLGIFFLCASILVHELGHFLVARWRGLVVERFSIGFGPRLFGWTRGGVDYRVSAIPLGGYVALPQLAGVRGLEGGKSDYDEGTLPPLSTTDKILVSLAGPAFNVIFALLLGCLLWATGRSVPASEVTTTIGYVAQDLQDRDDATVAGPAWKAGIRAGDRILAIDGHKVDSWTGVAQAIATGSDQDDNGHRRTILTVERAGKTLVLELSPITSPHTGLREIGVVPEMPAVIDTVYPNSPAQKAGLRKGDVIEEVDGVKILHYAITSRFISKTPLSAHTLSIRRGEEHIAVVLTPEMVSDGAAGQRPMIGVQWARDERKVVVYENPLKLVGTVFDMTFDVLRALLNPRSDVSLSDMSGPVNIAHALIASAKENFGLLLFLVLFINVNLAVVNLLPIPVLDGGHIAFALIEKLTGRPLPQRILSGSQVTFMALLLGLMAYITLHDIFREIDMARTNREIRSAEKAPPPVFPADAQPAPAPAAPAAPAESPAK